MANPIIKIKRGLTAPTATLNAGEFAIDQDAKNLYLGVEVGGVTTNEIVGGSGTFATKQFVTDAVNAGTGSLGTMSTQDDDSVAIVGGTINNSVNALFIYGAEISSSPIDNSAIGANIASTGNFTTLTATALDGNIDASTAVVTYGVFQTAVINGTTEITDSLIDSTPIGATTPSTGAFTTLTASSAPSASNDVVRKTDLDSAVSALGSVFHYVGNVSLATTPFDLATLPDLTTGAYYRVDVAGTYVDATYPDVEAKVGDAFIFTAANGFQKLDNVDVVVSGTTDEITVLGDENSGYVVSLTTGTAGSWKDSVDNDLSALYVSTIGLEAKTQNIDLATTAGTTKLTGTLETGGIAATVGQPVLDITASGLVQISSPELVVLGALSADEKLTVFAGGFEVTGNSTLTGNLSVTGNITDAVIDGGVY